MLTREETSCHEDGIGHPHGEAMRRYWIPLSSRESCPNLTARL